MTESIKSGEENKEIALKVSGLTKQFSLEAGFFAKNKKTVYAVNDVSFEIPSGSTYGIVGEPERRFQEDALRILRTLRA